LREEECCGSDADSAEGEEGEGEWEWEGCRHFESYFFFSGERKIGSWKLMMRRI
jgi:hypothetical protein